MANGTALLIVDVQNDFCEGGSLPVTGGVAVAQGIANYIQHRENNPDTPDFDAILASQDWHIDPGSHFSQQPDYRDSWPVHCRAGSTGAQLRPELAAVAERIQAFFRKGRYSAAYSAFEGRLAFPQLTSTLEPDAVTENTLPNLDSWLQDHSIKALTIVGIATDHCVRASALDALRLGYSVRLVSQLCAGVHPDSTAAALTEMVDAGAQVVDDAGSEQAK